MPLSPFSSYLPLPRALPHVSAASLESMVFTRYASLCFRACHPGFGPVSLPAHRLEAVRDTWLRRAAEEREAPARQVSERMLAYQRDCESRAAAQAGLSSLMPRLPSRDGSRHPGFSLTCSHWSSSFHVQLGSGCMRLNRCSPASQESRERPPPVPGRLLSRWTCWGLFERVFARLSCVTGESFLLMKTSVSPY